jgi:hypothetical protein
MAERSDASAQYSVSVSPGAEEGSVLIRPGKGGSRSGPLSRKQIQGLLEDLEKAGISKLPSSKSGNKNDGYDFRVRVGQKVTEFKIYWDQVQGSADEKSYRDVKDIILKFSEKHATQTQK